MSQLDSAIEKFNWFIEVAIPEDARPHYRDNDNNAAELVRAAIRQLGDTSPSAEVARAADTIAALNTRMGNGADMPWRARELRREAEELAAEEREAAQRSALIAELAEGLYEARYAGEFALAHATSKTLYLGVAAKLIDSGWRKGEA